MIKSYMFASMYTFIGVTGWGAYSTISTEDTSLNAIKQIANTVTAKSSENSAPISKSLYRWKDHKGNWQYGDIPALETSMENYEKELEFLRALPREVLPSQALKPTDKNNDIFSLPSMSNVASLMNSQESESPTSQNSVSKLLEDTKNLKKVIQERNELLNNLK